MFKVTNTLQEHYHLLSCRVYAVNFENISRTCQSYNLLNLNSFLVTMKLSFFYITGTTGKIQTDEIFFEGLLSVNMKLSAGNWGFVHIY